MSGILCESKERENVFGVVCNASRGNRSSKFNPQQVETTNNCIFTHGNARKTLFFRVSVSLPSSLAELHGPFRPSAGPTPFRLYRRENGGEAIPKRWSGILRRNLISGIQDFGWDFFFYISVGFRNVGGILSHYWRTLTRLPPDVPRMATSDGQLPDAIVHSRLP